MICQVERCRFLNSHITLAHKCGNCRAFGHGIIECPKIMVKPATKPSILFASEGSMAEYKYDFTKCNELQKKDIITLDKSKYCTDINCKCPNTHSIESHHIRFNMFDNIYGSYKNMQTYYDDYYKYNIDGLHLYAYEHGYKKVVNIPNSCCISNISGMGGDMVVYNLNGKVDWKCCSKNLDVYKNGVIDEEFSAKLKTLKLIKLSYY